MSRAHLAFGGRGLVGLGLLWALPFEFACSGTIPADPYLGTVDPSGFDAMVGFPTSSSKPEQACLQPRSGFGGPGGLDRVTWIYLGGLTTTQLDISNASDPTRALPAAVYQVNGCNAPEGRAAAHDFDKRLDNYLQDRQYPVLSQGLVPALAGAAAEPTRLSTYKPWHVVVPVDIQGSVVDRMGCNDIKGERSLLERAGWSRETKMFPDSGPTDFDIRFPSRDTIRSGSAKFKDWPMVSVAVPVMSSTLTMQSCPFVLGNSTRPPEFPGDPMASFQFPSQHWVRGLLGGYLDGGDLPVTTDPLKCPALVSTVTDCDSGPMQGCPAMDTCMAGTCKMAGTPCDPRPKNPCTGPGQVCSSATAAGKCLAPVPICPKVNDLYVAVDEVPIPSSMTVSNPIPNPTVVLKDPMDMTNMRQADILAFFAATPGQDGYSPVCRLRFFDKKKLTTCPMEPETKLPRPLCTIAEINDKGAVVPTTRDYYVHCLFAQPPAR